MKEKIIAFLDGLILYDYILFGSAFFLFILFIVLTIVFRKKPVLATFFALLSFLSLFLLPSVGYIQMHKYLFKNSIEIYEQKKLNFTKAIVIKGKLKNESKFDFKVCKITTEVHKVSKNKLKNFVYKFKPFVKASIMEYDIKKGEIRDFKMFVEPFTYKRDFNTTTEAQCR